MTTTCNIITPEDLRSHAENIGHSERRIYPIGPLLDAAVEIERLQAILTAIATMECYTREDEEPAHILMMRMAREAIGG